MIIAFPEGTKAIIDSIRDVVGRRITIYVQEGQVACSGCELDPITGYSQDSFCIICGGLYWTPTISGYSMSGHVRWTGADAPLWTPGGIIPEGDCMVTVEYTADNLDHVERSNTWLVDAKTLYMKSFQLRGIRGDSDTHSPNRIRVTLLQEER